MKGIDNLRKEVDEFFRKNTPPYPPAVWNARTRWKNETLGIVGMITLLEDYGGLEIEIKVLDS